VPSGSPIEELTVHAQLTPMIVCKQPVLVSSSDVVATLIFTTPTLPLFFPPEPTIITGGDHTSSASPFGVAIWLMGSALFAADVHGKSTLLRTRTTLLIPSNCQWVISSTGDDPLACIQEWFHVKLIQPCVAMQRIQPDVKDQYLRLLTFTLETYSIPAEHRSLHHRHQVKLRKGIA
jgi:hypothetical protein